MVQSHSGYPPDSCGQADTPRLTVTSHLAYPVTSEPHPSHSEVPVDEDDSGVPSPVAHLTASL